MNVHAIYHTPKGEYAFPVSRNRSVIRLRTARDDFAKVELVVGLKYSVKKLCSVPMAKRFSDSLFDYYECEIDTDCGRRVYHFALADTSGNRMVYTEVGVAREGEIPEAYFPCFQIPFMSESDVLRVPDKFKNAVIYQIFPDRFYAKTPKLDWKKRPTASDIFGGDLYGVAEKLDYISSLGVNTIYLTPINPSHTNHHYDVEDYYAVADDLGGDRAFSELVQKAHAKGIKIIVDGVFNHCSAFNPIFADVVEHGKNSKYYDWFLINGDAVKMDRHGYNIKSCNYETFAWNVGYMPKLNCDNQAVRDFVCDVTTYWIKKFGVDAWRLDVADDVSPALWREVRKAIKAADPDAIMIGEDWMDPGAFLNGDVFDGVMNYGFLRAVRDCFAYGKITAAQAAERLIRNYNRTNSPSARMMMNIIGSHDTHRFLSLCKGNLFNHTAAVCTMFFYDGMPTVYYGDELPLEGEQDPDCRRGFDWSRTGGRTAELIKTLADMRTAETGDTKMFVSGEQGVLEMERVSDGKTNSLIINSADKPVKTNLGTVSARSIVMNIDGKNIEIKE